MRPVVKENEPLLSIKFNDFIHFFRTNLYGIADVYAAVHHSQSHDLPGSRRRCLQKNRGRLSKNGPGNVPFSVPLGRAAKPCFAATPAAPVRHGLSTRSSLHAKLSPTLLSVTPRRAPFHRSPFGNVRALSRQAFRAFRSRSEPCPPWMIWARTVGAFFTEKKIYAERRGRFFYESFSHFLKPSPSTSDTSPMMTKALRSVSRR